jgi:CubicO group peptidase (beta-lactamase class C family)
MRRAFLIALAGLAAPALAAPPAGFDQRVEQLRTAYDAPGVSIAIVENGAPTLAKGWGVREIGKPEPVGPDTIFGVGSVSKAFTVAALAILVDEGKLKWDDKIIDHMTDFRMFDPWVTREMTVRDLLVHRSGLGLGAGDLLFVPNSDLSRKETVRRLRFIKPATSFRSAYAYDNILYMVAGELVEAVSGEPWEKFLRTRLFAPLGMKNSTDTNAEFQATADRAHLHGRIDGPIVGLGHQETYGPDAVLAHNAAPAGGLAISANDMTRWLLAQLNHGQIPGGSARLFSAEQSNQMWNPVTLEPISPQPPEFAATQPNFHAYALGWDVQDYRGIKIISHGGAVFGSLTQVVLIPSKNVGFSIAVNSEDGEIVRGLMYELLDHYFGFPSNGWPEKYHALKIARLADAAKLVSAKKDSPTQVGPSLPLDRYVGDYADPWYGTIHVRRAGNALAIQFPHSTGMDGMLIHHQYDTFRTQPRLRWIEPAYVTFSIDADGKVDRVRMMPVSPLADFSFDYRDLDFTLVVTAAN